MSEREHSSAGAAEPPLGATRSLQHLEAFLRVIRVPRADVAAMLDQAPAATQAALAAVDPVAGALAPLGWIVFEAAPREVYARAAATIYRRGPDGPSGPDTQAEVEAEGLLVAWWNDGPDRLSLLPQRVRGLYAPRDATATMLPLGAGRAELLAEAVANHRDGRYASAIALTISQLDGIAADVPPTPNAAFPFLIDDARDDATHDPLIDAALLATHPGSLEMVARLMRTSRPNTNVTGAIYRHGIMHGRDLGSGTLVNSTKVLTLLLALIEWATPVAAARAARQATPRH